MRGRGAHGAHGYEATGKGTFRFRAACGGVLFVAACVPGLRSGGDRASAGNPLEDASAPLNVDAGGPSPGDGYATGNDPDAGNAAFEAGDAALDAVDAVDAVDAALDPGDAALDAADAVATLGCARHRKYVAGDVDGDGRGDIILTGGTIPNGGGPWNTIPVAFSSGGGEFVVTNSFVSDFPIYAAQGPVAVGGDANGDGRLDIIAAGGLTPSGTPWGSVPVAASAGRSGFAVTNDPLADFAALAEQPGPTILSGDFDGDGLFDLALAGTAAWTTVPLALSNGDGSFRSVRRDARDFAGAIIAGTRAISGDFDGDGAWDLAFLGVAATDTIVVAYSMPNGSFRTVFAPAPSLSAHVGAGSLVVGGDFDGDGRDDIALAGATGAGEIVLALSRPTSFLVLSAQESGFTSLAAQAPQLVSLDADGDGCSDLALVGGADAAKAPWTTIPVAFSKGDGSFRITNQTVPDFPIYATQGAMAVSASAARR